VTRAKKGSAGCGAIGFWRCAALVGLISGFHLPSSLASAQVPQQTNFLNINIGSSRANIARALANGGYELEDGTPISFEPWYSPRYPELNITFLTQMSPSLGLIWGVSLGEGGEKYQIDPGVWLGLVYRAQLGRRSSLTFTATTLVGGNFRESACIAYYRIGGIQPVNCRLAATVLPPAETLQFLVNERGFIESRASIRYDIRF
jgi:hypothetical protein